MDFRILGLVEARRNGVPLTAIGPKQRALLALLLLHANEPMPRASLVDGLWGDDPPETAAKALQVYVSQLRRLVGRELIRTRPGGYQLEIAPAALDLLRFQGLVAEARASAPAAAARKLREALALWTGPALADVADAAFAQTETGRLEELRLAAADELVDAELALGYDGELVSELERRVASNPLRERPRGQLMLALYRSGRQAEALECYQNGRRALVGDLGLEPGRQLHELHQAILQQDAALEAQLAPEPQQEAEVSGDEPIAPIPREARKTVTAVHVALASVSGDGEPLDPEALRQVTNSAFGEIKAAVERHGGTVETVAVDAISAVFGLPTLHEDDALRAVRSAAELRTRLIALATKVGAERGVRLAFRVGVSTGEVVTGGDAASQIRATGIPLAMSSQLAQIGDAGEIIVDDSTVRLARDGMVGVDLVVGTSSAVRLVRTAAEVPRHPSRLVSPMVGREREQRRLLDAFEQAVGDRSCQLFTVLGSAGVGKSRLIREFLGAVAGRALVIRGRCLAYGEGITFWPLLEAVKEAAGLDDEDSPAAAGAKLVAALGAEPDADVLAQRVAELIGLSDVHGVAEVGIPSVLSLFQALARAQPLVVVFDDIHWGEPTFLDLVEHVADWARDAPILLVCLARPELLETRSGWGGGKLNATSTLLEPLSDGECAVLIQNLVGQAELGEEVQTKIAGAAEGNPLFVEEMLSMLIDDGVLARRDGRWVATRDVPEVRVPPTIQALLAARLDRLGVDERAVIERAAVHGKILFEEAVVDFAPEGLRTTVAESLAALVRKDLIRPDRASLGGRTYRFRHLLIRDAAYDSIPKDARVVTHERFARWLEHAAGERATEYDEIVGYHLEQAYRYRTELGPIDERARSLGRSAAERLGVAGRRAFARSDPPAALNLISRAVSLLPPEDPLRVDLVPGIRGVQGMGADMSWADRVLTQAVEAAATSGDRRLAAHALVQRGLLRLFTVWEVTPQELLDAAERSIAVFAESSDELGLARSWRLKAQAHYLARRAGGCAEASERALAHGRRARDRFEEREITEWLVIALLLGPTAAADAARRCERLLAETAGDILLQAQTTGALAWLRAMLGQTDAAEELVARSRTIMDKANEWSWFVSFSCGCHYLWQRDPVAAELELRPGYETLKEVGGAHFSSFSHLLANAVYLQGRHAEAEQLTRECEEASRPNDVLSHILWRSTRAKVLARRGEHGAAEQLARDAVAFASKSDFTLARAEALMDLAEVLELASARDAALEPLRQAIILCEEKGNLPAVGLVRSRMEELSEPG
jgi:DNA-binding SARP family transcriptional activator